MLVLPFESRLLILLVLLVVFLLANLAKKLGPSRFVEFVRGFLRGPRLVMFNAFILILGGLIGGSTFFARPFVIRSTPAWGAYMSTGEQIIEVEFDLPVDTDSIKFNLSPEVEGSWVLTKMPLLPLRRRARFYPKESFFPGDKVVVYVVGLRSRWGQGGTHEQSIEFYAPRIPNIKTTSPCSSCEDVPVDSGVVIQYDAPVGKFVDFRFEIDPKVEFTVISPLLDKGGVESELRFDNQLAQDEEYKIDIYRTPRSYHIESGEEIKLGDTEKIETLVFKTAATPLIASYSPRGSNVLVDETIKVVFDQDMNRESVESRFKINPAVEGKISWEDDRTFLFRPTDVLKKETEYEVVFAESISSKVGGITQADIRIKFKTIGRVAVASTYPVSGAYGLNPNTTNVVVGFNQSVDHNSAQQKFSVSPPVPGYFSWSGNRMTYHTAGKLSYSMRYDIKVSAGVKTVYGLDSTQDFEAYFVTRDWIFALAIPQYYQQLPEGQFDCNLTGARMVLAYRGISVTDAQIKSAIGIGQDPDTSWVAGYGVHAAPVANYIKSQGRSVVIKTGWNVAELIKEIENGNPVILWWYNRYSQPKGSFTLPGGYTGYKGTHSEVVRGFVGNPSNPTSLLTNDPWRGQLSYSQSLFISTWAYLNYTAVVVY